MQKFILAIFIFTLPVVYGQIGGNNAFSFLDLTYNARSLGLGGDFITVKDADLNLGISNPSLLNSENHQHVSFNQALMPAGINFGMVNYGRQLKNDVSAAVHLRYIDYGKMIRRDEIGNELGVFKPMDAILGVSAAKPFSPRMSIGATVNFIFSQLESYTSLGASLDMAGNYYNEENEFLATLLVKNAGYQFKGYTEKTHNPLPVELQFGLSKKLAHAPFRFSLLAHHLNIWDLTYNDPSAKPSIDALTGDTIPVPRAGTVEKIARHFTYQVEILLTKNLHIRTAFDYHRRQEMKLETRPAGAGFSLGAGFYFRKFSLDYGFQIQSRAGYFHMISLQTDLSKWRK